MQVVDTFALARTGDLEPRSWINASSAVVKSAIGSPGEADGNGTRIDVTSAGLYLQGAPAR
jgi:hypothetical protein